MKGSLATSAILHAAVLAGALFTFGAPPAFEVQDVESLPVDIVPIEEFTRIQEGDRQATAEETPAPVPTKRQDAVQDAQDTGENEVDLKSLPTPNARPENIEAAAAPEPVDVPVPTLDDKPNDVKDIIQEETETAKATEVATLAEPKRDVKPEPKPEAQAEATTAEEEIVIPDAVPLPTARPEPKKQQETAKKEAADTTAAQAQTAKTPDRKKSEEKKETAKAASSKKADQIANETAALLNKQDAAGGGAKRSNKEAALGAKKNTGGSKLSQSEMDALRGAIEKNWSIVSGMADAQDVRVTVKMKLDESGDIIGQPEVTATGGSAEARDVLAASARRAVLRTAPFTNLPKEKYDAWNEVIVNFDPSALM